MAKLIVNPTSSSRREIALPRTLVSIGRDPSNDVVLPDAMVSRRHAVIEFRGSQYFLRDCNSSNGSLVNGDRVSERNLRDGDLVAIGTARLLFREDLDAEEPGAKVVQHPSAPRLHCPACQADYRKGDLFCRQCGGAVAPSAPPKAVCASCGTAVLLPARFCNACGRVPRRGAASAAGRSGRRRDRRPASTRAEPVPGADAERRGAARRAPRPRSPASPAPAVARPRTACRAGAPPRAAAPAMRASRRRATARGSRRPAAASLRRGRAEPPRRVASAPPAAARAPRRRPARRAPGGGRDRPRPAWRRQAVLLTPVALLLVVASCPPDGAVPPDPGLARPGAARLGLGAVYYVLFWG